MRYQLFITVCSVAFISLSASAYDASPDDGVLGQIDNSAGTVIEHPKNLAAPRSLPVARDGEIIDSVGGGATEAVLPVVQTANRVSYITGGIGDEELAEINAQESNFNARIVMIATNGEYMSEIAVRILSKDGELVRLEDVGPYLYANLPDGSYTVEAVSSSGGMKSAKFTVPARKPKVKTVIRFDE